MCQRLFLLFSFVLLTVSIFAQANIEGRVMDGNKNTPLEFANLFADGLGTTSDLSGHFQLTLPVGRHLVTCSYIGYRTDSIVIDIVPNSVYQIDFVLLSDNELLNTVVVTGGRFEKPLAQSVVSIAVLAPEVIEQNNTTSLDDALNRMSGVDVIDGQANIRGGSGYSYGAGSRVLLLLDGMPIMQTDAAFPNWKDMPIENIGQVEVLKGAASSLYGSSALNGVVNLQSAYPTHTPYLKIAPFYTTYLSPKDNVKKWWDKNPQAAGLSAVYRQRIKKLGISLGGYYLSEDSYMQGVYTRYGRGFIGLSYHPTERLVVGIRGNINPGATSSYFYWKNETDGIYQPADNTLTETKRLRFSVDPYVRYYDQWNNKHKLQFRYFSADNDNENDQATKSSMLYGEYQFQRNFEALRLKLVAGLAYMGSAVDAELYGDTTYSGSNSAAYLQLEKNISKRLILTAGVRYESNVLKSPEIVSWEVFNQPYYDTIPGGKTQDARPVFRAGLNWNPVGATFIRASWGQGYRYPTVAEKFITTTVSGLPILPNVDLNPESGRSIEVGVKQGFKLFDLKGFIDLSFFDMQYNNMMEFAFGGVDGQTLGFASINVGHTQIQGLDASLAGQGDTGPIGHQFIFGYTFIEPTYRDFSDKIKESSSSDQNMLKYRFKHSWKGDWSLDFEKWDLGVAVVHHGPTEAVDRILEAVIPGAKQYRMDNNTGFTKWDARIGYHATEQLRLSVIGKNIFNKEYSTRIGLLEAPMNLTFKVEWKL